LTKGDTVLKCPFCNYADTKVIDSRAQDDNAVIRRRRLCESCGKRFTTYERIDMIPITVIKRDGTREIFDKTKLIGGIMKSCNKRPVTAKQIEDLVDDVENTLIGGGEREVDSKQIGNMVMDRLKELDEVAYVRFASVYRQFKDINTFVDELQKMLSEKRGML
jgi:transcriptional repressor NrdR